MATRDFFPYFKIKEPDFPPENSYEKIVTYLVDSNTAAINYYRLVSICGCIGFIFLGVLIYEDGFNKLSIIKGCPAAIYSGLTFAFGRIEIEKRKKALYKKLKDIASDEGTFDDKYKIVGDYKSWSWEEFKNIFKP